MDQMEFIHGISPFTKPFPKLRLVYPHLLLSRIQGYIATTVSVSPAVRAFM